MALIDFLARAIRYHWDMSVQKIDFDLARQKSGEKDSFSGIILDSGFCSCILG